MSLELLGGSLWVGTQGGSFKEEEEMVEEPENLVLAEAVSLEPKKLNSCFFFSLGGQAGMVESLSSSILSFLICNWK